MAAGQFKHRVLIQSLQPGQDKIGQPTTTWATFKTLGADIRTLGGLESIKADAQAATTKASIRVRYRTDITADMRVVHGSTVYEIKAVLPDEQRRDHLDLSCEVIA
jgi:SPP1 family predicted phage head-tail adaptor